MPWFFAAFLLLFLLPLVLAMIIPIYKRHNKTTGKVQNYDSSMSKFVYKVYMSREEIINKLKSSSSIDELSCDIDLEREIFIFSDYSSNRKYYFQIQVCDGFSILRLEQFELFGMSSHIPYKLNPYLVSKLQAEIIPFSKYGL